MHNNFAHGKFTIRYPLPVKLCRNCHLEPEFFTQRLKFTDVAAAKDALQDLDKIIARKPYPSLDGLRNIQRALRHNPGVAKIKVEDVIDDRIYRKLEDSGFIDNVFKFTNTR